MRLTVSASGFMKGKAVGVVLLGLFAFAVPAAANVEIAPFAGLRFGGSLEDIDTGGKIEINDSSSFGLILDFDSEPGKQIEVYLSRQATRLDTTGVVTGDPRFDLVLDTLHIGGLYFPTPDERFAPFVSGTFGLTRITPDRADLEAEHFFSVALGFGAKAWFGKSFGLRLDARGIYTAIDSGSTLFCSGGCTVRIHSNGFWQAETGVALVFRF